MAASAFLWVVFAGFVLMALVGGVVTVTHRNLFQAGMGLLLALFGVAGLLALLLAPFLAAAQVLIYMGGIAVLIIFVVMLTRQVTAQRQPPKGRMVMGALLALGVFALLGYAVYQMAFVNTAWAVTTPPELSVEEVGASVAGLGQALVDVSQFVLPFEVASVLLLAALVGGIAIASPPQENNHATES